MNVFVIHSGKDRPEIEKKLSSIKQKCHSFNPLALKNGNAFWKIDARKKIKKAQMVIFFVGESSHTSKNIDWELCTAIKFQKPIYIIRLNDDFKINTVLEIEDSFSEQTTLYGKLLDFDDISDLIKKYESGDYKVFNQEINSENEKILLEQYKVFLQTSEDLVTRRQSVNNFYISINSALIGAFGILWTSDVLPVYKFVMGVLISLVGVILCASWIKLLVSYGNLNSSKMKIISYIEKQLPASLYDAEWAALSDKLNKRKYISFTNSEKRVPVLFIVLYICISVCGIIFLF